MNAPAAKAPAPPPAAWTPSLRWHLKALAWIYAALAVVYLLLTAFLSRLPAPYGLREIPAKLTPWLKK